MFSQKSTNRSICALCKQTIPESHKVVHWNNQKYWHSYVLTDRIWHATNNWKMWASKLNWNHFLLHINCNISRHEIVGNKHTEANWTSVSEAWKTQLTLCNGQWRFLCITRYERSRAACRCFTSATNAAVFDAATVTPSAPGSVEEDDAAVATGALKL